MHSCRVTKDGKLLDFTSKEFDLLTFFLCHPGESLSRERLLDEVWGYEVQTNSRTVDAHLVRLRQKLEPIPEQPRFFLTVHGTGYKFAA
jgi:two-component system alkaline phosphatase synthesis response regulator PhoP